jgi:hypothetical protein
MKLILEKDIIERGVKYMRVMKFPQHIIDQFQGEEHSVCLSINGKTEPVPYLIHQEIKRIEEEYGLTVYHVTFTPTLFGACYECLYVSNESDEWEVELEDAKAMHPIAYVINTKEKLFSEFGAISIKVHSTYIQRVG